MEKDIVYLVYDGIGEVFAVCDRDGLDTALRERTKSISIDTTIELCLDGPEPRAIVCFYASSDSPWHYSYSIRKMKITKKLQGF